MTKFIIRVRQYSPDENDRLYIVEEKVGRWPWQRWRYVNSYPTLEEAEASIKRLVEYPRAVETRYYYENGNQEFDGVW